MDDPKTTVGSRYTTNPPPAPAGNTASPSKTSQTTSTPGSSAAKPTQPNATAQQSEFETLLLQLSRSDAKALSSVQIVKQLLNLLNKEWAKVSTQNPHAYSERNRQLVPYFEYLRSQINTLPADQMVNLKSDLLNNFDDLFGKLERSSPLNSAAINSRNTARQYIKGVIEKL